MMNMTYLKKFYDDGEDIFEEAFDDGEDLFEDRKKFLLIEKFL